MSQDLSHSESIVIASTPEQLYAMVTDIKRMGEWSPVCKDCWWDEGQTLQVGATFTGRNVTPERTWETKSEVVVADPGKEFAFDVNGGWARWGYRFEPVADGTEVTEYWEFLPAGIEGFRNLLGDGAQEQIDIRIEGAHSGIHETLAALKAAAESTD